MELYQILEIKKSATQAEIKKAYYKLSKKYHPDVTNGNPELTEKFKEIKEAYGVLSDPEKRKKYDRTGLFSSKVDIDAEINTFLTDFVLTDVINRCSPLYLSQHDFREIATQCINIQINNQTTQKEKLTKPLASLNVILENLSIKNDPALKSKYNQFRENVLNEIKGFENQIKFLNLALEKVSSMDYKFDARENNYSTGTGE